MFRATNPAGVTQRFWKMHRMMAQTTATRRSRAWLYGPFIVLGLIAIGWSAFWFYARGKSEEILDRLIAREAGLGRAWTCQDRTISGFPFRFEARCSAIALAANRADGQLGITSGPLVLLAQIYNPQHILLQAKGPALVTAPDGERTTLRWSSYESSFFLNGLDPDRLSTVITDPVVEGGSGDLPFRAASLEIHARRNPTRPASDAVTDIALKARAASLPVLDAYAGNSAPADIDLTASITRSLVFRTGIKPANLDLWQASGGRAEIARLAIAKETAKLETRGELGLDEQRRLTGRLETSATGLERILAQLTGISVGNIGGLGGLLAGRAPAPQAGAGPQLKPLPALEFREGRIQAGPLRIPRVQLRPLY